MKEMKLQMTSLALADMSVATLVLSANCIFIDPVCANVIRYHSVAVSRAALSFAFLHFPTSFTTAGGILSKTF